MTRRCSCEGVQRVVIVVNNSSSSSGLECCTPSRPAFESSARMFAARETLAPSSRYLAQALPSKDCTLSSGLLVFILPTNNFSPVVRSKIL